VSLLTPPGAGAIATVEVCGPRAWEFARQLFRPAGKPLPESPELHRFWFGKLGDGAGDEVILAACGETLEIHCHGGRRVVRWVIEQFLALGCNEREASPSGSLLKLLSHAPTLRTASILLDQLHGAFDTEVRRILGLIDADPGTDPGELGEVRKFAPVGRHLIEPWKVVVAGPPNVGKSSLVNALAGYQRAVVSEVAGTTRDAVTVPLAFDGWPVELTDTAGLRDAEGLEAAGIDRAKRVLAEADVVLWVLDGSDPNPVWADVDIPAPRILAVINKADLPNAWSRDDVGDAWGILHVSAATGAGIPVLVAEIVRRLVPFPPPPGGAVPYTPQLADAVTAAHEALSRRRFEEAAGLLRACLHVG
jgi:tRNA modification GTPase